MPIYEYECPVCGARKEEIHAMDAHPEIVCDDLGGSVHPTFQHLMVRVMSVNAPPRMGGFEGKIRGHRLAKDRNDAYSNSATGRAEHRANVAAAHKRVGI